MRLIDADGENRGIVKLAEAQRIAQTAGLDLVEVAADARPPVVRIMDYGKWRYEQEQKAKQARRHQSTITIKEIKFRPKIDPHDYATKKGHVERFLRHRDKVKVTIMFRGRELLHPERGEAILLRLADELKDLAVVESRPRAPRRAEPDAQDEDPPRREEAVQDHRDGPDPVPARRDAAQPREHVGQGAAPPVQGGRPRARDGPGGQADAGEALMARVKRSVAARKKRRKVLEQASGYWGTKHSSYKRAKEQVQRSLRYAYRDRRVRKRDFRRLWITRINAAARENGLTYGELMHGLRLAEVELDRKILAELATHEPAAFAGLCDRARTARENAQAAA